MGVHIDLERIQMFGGCLPLWDFMELPSLLGLANIYRIFVLRFSQVACLHYTWWKECFSIDDVSFSYTSLFRHFSMCTSSKILSQFFNEYAPIVAGQTCVSSWPMGFSHHSVLSWSLHQWTRFMCWNFFEKGHLWFFYYYYSIPCFYLPPAMETPILEIFS